MWVAEDDTEHYLWLVVLGAFGSFFAAFGIGANDVANAFATSVGSKALTVRQACVVAVVFEFLGATLLGGEVVKTVRKGIADPKAFEDNPPLLMWGCFCVTWSVGIWLIVATRFEMPVSTTHSAIGGMIGMAIAARGGDAVVWSKDKDDFPYVGGFAGVVCSWFISPVFSGILAAGIFWIIRRVVLRAERPFERAVRVYPVLVCVCVWIVVTFLLSKGIKSSSEIKKLDAGWKVLIGFLCGLVVAVAMLPVYSYLKERIESGKFVAPKLAIDVVDAKPTQAEADTEATTTRSSTPVESTTVQEERPSVMDRVAKSLMSSLNADPHAIVGTDDRTRQVHLNAERFDPNTEAFFCYLQIFSACFDAFAHGANDVANAVGPFATVFFVYQSGEVGKKIDMGDNKYWILGLGGVGIGFGLLLYGSQILRAIGTKLAVITPARGFSIEMGSSLVVILGSYQGWPLSTTHCQVGATVGVALLEGVRGFNYAVFARAALGWVLTCVVVGLIAGLLTTIGASAPSSRLPTCVNSATLGT